MEPIKIKYINGITTTFMLTLLAVLGNQEKPPILNRSKDLGVIILNKSQNTHFILGGGWLYSGGWLSPKPSWFYSKAERGTSPNI